MASIAENVQNSSVISLTKFFPHCSRFMTIVKNIVVMFSNVDDLLYNDLPERAETMNCVLQQILVGKKEHDPFRVLRKRVSTR